MIGAPLTFGNGWPQNALSDHLLGHKPERITTHYSAPDIARLIEAANKVCEPRHTESASWRRKRSRKSHARRRETRYALGNIRTEEAAPDRFAVPRGFRRTAGASTTISH
jgi:hypothetical protein